MKPYGSRGQPSGFMPYGCPFINHNTFLNKTLKKTCNHTGWLKPTSPVSFFHRFVIASALAVQHQNDDHY
jgi:hypothetical protein